KHGRARDDYGARLRFGGSGVCHVVLLCSLYGIHTVREEVFGKHSIQRGSSGLTVKEVWDVIEEWLERRINGGVSGGSFQFSAICSSHDVRMESEEVDQKLIATFSGHGVKIGGLVVSVAPPGILQDFTQDGGGRIVVL